MNSPRKDFWSSNSNNNKLLSKRTNSSKKRPTNELNYSGYSKKWSKEWLSVVTSSKKRNVRQLKNRESFNWTQNKRKKNKGDFQRKKSVRRLSCSKKNKVTTLCKRRLKTVEKSSKSSDKNTKVLPMNSRIFIRKMLRKTKSCWTQSENRLKSSIFLTK